MKPIKVCYVQHASERPFVRELVLSLKPHNVEVTFVCKTRDAHEQYLADGFESHFISDIFNAPPLSEEVLLQLDKTYSPPGIRSVYDSDVQLQEFFGREVQKAEQVIAKACLFWERFFDERAIDYVLCREVATFATRTAYLVARRRGIPLSQITIGPGEGRFIMSDLGKTSVWSELLEYVHKGLAPLTEAQKNEVQDFIDARIPKTRGKMLLRFISPPLLQSLRELLGMLRYDTARIRRDDPIRVAALRYGKYQLLKRLQWRYLTRLFYNYDVPKDEPFVYFPFYSGKETGYLVDDHFFAVNQLPLIEEVAASLPVGMMLYVKEHPTNPGNFTYRELRALKTKQNIRVLKPEVASQMLVEKSVAVCVLQGTAGWEAFLSQKPVISIGRSFFAYSPLVFTVDQLSELVPVLRKAADEGERRYKEREDEWLWFIYGVISTCGRGEVVRLRPPYGFPAEKENADRVARFVAEKIKRAVA